MELAGPIFWNFSRNSLRWKNGLDYTLTNGVGKQGRRADPTHPKGQNRLFWKKIPEIRCGGNTALTGR